MRCVFAHCFTHFCCNNTHFCILLMFADSRQCHFLVVRGFFCRCAFRFVVLAASVYCPFAFRLLFVFGDGLSLFFLPCSCHHFLMQIVYLVDIFACPCFTISFCLAVCFVAFSADKHIGPAHRTPYSPYIDHLHPL